MTKGRKGYGTPKVVLETYTPYKDHILPDDVVSVMREFKQEDYLVRNAYIKALRLKGWTLQSVGDAVGISRERIRQIEANTPDSHVEQIYLFPEQFPVPSIPTKVIEKIVYEAVEPNPETLARLLELQPYAQLVRSHSPRYRVEAEEYAALLWKAHDEEKVTLYRLAKCLGVTHGALRFRLVRYGYMKASQGGKSRSYQPIMDKNRARSE